MKKKIINTSLIIISIFITLYTIETSLIFFPPTIKKDIEYKQLKQMTESKGGVYRDKYNELNFLRKEKEIKITINARYTNLNLYTEFFHLDRFQILTCYIVMKMAIIKLLNQINMGLTMGNTIGIKIRKKLIFF